jgi:hypothetical protein
MQEINTLALLRFIVIRVKFSDLVLLADRNNLREFAQLPLHAIDSLNNHNNLLPRPMRTRLASCNLLSQYIFQVSRICKKKIKRKY